MSEPAVSQGAYVSYTTCVTDNPEGEACRELWRWANPIARRQPGCELVLTLESSETPGQFRTMSVWTTKEDFDTWVARPEHAELDRRFEEVPFRIIDRDFMKAAVEAS